MRGIILDPNSYNGIQRLSREQKGELLEVIFIYNNTGEIPEMTNMVGMAFDMMRGFFDTQIIKYKEKCDKNKENADKRWHKETDTNVSEGIQENATASERIKNMPIKSNEIKSNQTKPNEIKLNKISSKEDTTQALVVSEEKENKSKPEINNLIDSIKQTLDPLGLIYKKGKYERERAQNILTAKEFGETCEKAGMSREKFVIEIIKLSAKLDFWNGKIYNCETFYEHYPKVYNEARRMKKEKETKKIHSY